MKEAIESITGLPWYALAGAGLFLIVLVVLFFRAVSEGREVSLWPPKIGPRPTSQSEDLTKGGNLAGAANEAGKSRSVPEVTLTARPVALFYVEGGQTYVLTEAHRTLIVGRGQESDIVLNDIALSRSQFRLLIEPLPSETGGIRQYRVGLLDLGSANGTFVNGKRLVKKQLLQDGDLVQVGGLRATFRQLAAIV